MSSKLEWNAALYNVSWVKGPKHLASLQLNYFRYCNNFLKQFGKTNENLKTLRAVNTLELHTPSAVELLLSFCC